MSRDLIFAIDVAGLAGLGALLLIRALRGLQETQQRIMRGDYRVRRRYDPR